MRGIQHPPRHATDYPVLRQNACVSGNPFDAVFAFSLLSMMGEAPMQEVAYVLAMDRTTLTRNLTPLLREGLVEVRVGSDRRSRPLRLTAKGQSTLEKATPYWQKAQSGIVGEIGAEQWDALMRGLHQISMIVENSEENP
jgi:DNA-binding MarR family transcriptional regulator